MPLVCACARAGPFPHGTAAHHVGRADVTSRPIDSTAPRRARVGGSARITRAMAAVVLLLCAATAPAQEVTEPALKAAFIYHFAKFTEWPAEALPPRAPFVMCVLGASAIGDALERAVRGREKAGRLIRVSRVTSDGPLDTCHILYVSEVAAAPAAKLVAGLKSAPVLTISDLDGFTALGGIAQFFFERGQLRFNVQPASATRAGLRISSGVLSMSKRP